MGKLAQFGMGIAADFSTDSVVEKSIEGGHETKVNRKGR